MKNEKFCFSKGTGLIALIGIVLVGAVVLFANVTNQQTSTSTRASAPLQAYSCTTIPGGMDKSYYVKIINGATVYYKDAAGLNPVEGGAIGAYCKLDLASDRTCRDVKADVGCAKPLFQKRDANFYSRFYSNSACQGEIVDNVANPLMQDTIAAAYCNTNGATILRFVCPDNIKSFYSANGKYYSGPTLTTDITQLGVNNFCKILSGDPTYSGSTVIPVKCNEYVVGGLASKTIYNDLTGDYFYDVNRYFKFIEAEPYCQSNKTLTAWLADNKVKVACNRFVSGGNVDATLWYNGTSYLGGNGNNIGLRIMTPAQVCRKTVVTSTCNNYALAAGKRAINYDAKFKTSDEITFTEMDGITPIDNLSSFCQFLNQNDTEAWLEFNNNG